MKQVFVIHGGDAFASYEEYFASLQTYEVDDPRERTKGWKSLLSEHLGSEYEVIAPRMPNSANAKYAEWKLWFEKHFKFIETDVILVGHSLGASFLARYLSEEKFPGKILGTFLISGPFSVDEDRQLVEFVPPASLKLLEEQGGTVFLYHSKDDDVVNFIELGKYQAALPTATVRVHENQGHFIGDEIPGLIDDIKSLS